MVCLYALLLESYPLSLVASFLFSKLIRTFRPILTSSSNSFMSADTEQMYTLKPMITYYQSLYKQLRKNYQLTGGLSLPPSHTVPVLSKVRSCIPPSLCTLLT